jgi:tight adherence protein B
MNLPLAAGGFDLWQGLVSGLLLAGTFAAVAIGGRPISAIIRRQETEFTRILQSNLLLDVPGRLATMLSLAALALLAGLGFLITGGMVGAAVGGLIGAVLPTVVLRLLRRRRLRQLEDQLVPGIQTLSAGVRAGLNLVQSMNLVARDGPVPIRQEFGHMLREHEYGLPLEQAMDNAAARIGSHNYRLLFAALRTHRERGGDLGSTLDRIAESIREIQRLEKRIRTLTAQGRTTARWLSALPPIVLVILYFINPEGTVRLFTDDMGLVILAGIVAMNVVGYLWIKKIVSVDI